MEMSALVISIILTVGILALSILTITKGYGFKHTIDPATSRKKQTTEEPENKSTEI